MARRVNTRFVVILGGVLFVGAATVLAVMGRTYWHNRDPEYLKQMGDEALKNKDLVNAIRFYARAADASSRTHREGTDQLYTRLGDLSMEFSAQTPTAIDSSSLYRDAQTAWKRALTENAGYVPAREKLIEEQYKIATYESRTEAWTALEETAAKLIVQDKKYGKAFTYLAVARFALLQGSASMGLDAQRVAIVEQDIQRAMQEDPTSPMPWVMHANLLQLQALRMPAGNAKEARKLLDAAVASLQSFLEKHPHDADASMALARLHWGLKQQDLAIKVLEAAVAAQPQNVRLASMLSTCHGEQRSLDKAEKVLKDLVAAAPADPEAYMTLARYLQAVHKSKEAIEAFNKAMELPQSGGGIAAALNIRRQVESLFTISWIYLNMVEEKRRLRLAVEEKEALAQANVYITRLRASPSAKSSQDLLEGRLQLLGGNLREAIAALQRADADFGKSPSSPQWLQTKSALSQAHETLEEWGNALMYLEQILVQFPRNPGIILQKARVLCRVARWNEALDLVKPFANPAPDSQVPPELRTASLQVQAAAYRGLGMQKEYDDTEKKLGGPESIINVAKYKLAEGDFAGALQEVKGVLAEAPENESALALAVVINVRMDNRTEAAAILDKALALHPKNTQLQVIKVLLSKPDGDIREMQEPALDVISDPYTRHMAKAQFHGQMRDRVKQIAELEAAQKVVEESGGASAKEIISQISEQVFMLNLAWAEEAQGLATAAQARVDAAKDPAEKVKPQKEQAEQEAAAHKYFDQAELYVQRAERLNLDSLDGKLYRGRLEFAKGGNSRRVGIQILEQAVAARPSNSFSHTVLGQAYSIARAEKSGSSEKALEEFRTAIQQKPDNGIALRYAMELLINKGDTQSLNEAQGYLKQALAFTPRDPGLQPIRDVLDDPANSIRIRENTRKSNPGDLANLRRLGILYVRQGQPAKAVEMFRLIFEKYPNDLELADTVAHLEHEAHHDNEALTILDKLAANTDPQVSFRALLKLGDMYRLLNKPEVAKNTYRDAIAKEAADVDDAECRLGDLYFDLDDMKSAEETYRGVYKKTSKKDIRVLRRWAESLIRQDKFSDADALINTLFAQQPDDPDGWILRGFALLRQHQAAQAIECFDRVLKVHPENIDALHYRAFAQFSVQGDLDQAISDLRVVKERDPNRVNSRLLLAKVYRLTRRFAEAADEYETAIQKQPESRAFRIEYAEFLLSVVDVSQRLSPENQDDFARAVRVVRGEARLGALLKDSSGRFPTQPMWLILEGNLLTLKGLRAEALQKFREAFDASGDAAGAAIPYLGALLGAKNYEEVIKLTTYLLVKEPGNGDYSLKRAAAYAATGKSAEALADFSQAMSLAGADVETYLTVVREAEAVLPRDTFIAHMTQRANAQPQDAAAHIGLAEVLLTGNRASQAVAVLAPLAADPKSPHRILLLRMMGMAKYQVKDMEGAYQAYAELVKLTPADLEVLNNLAFILAEDLKRPKEGLKYAEEAVRILKSGRVDIGFVNNGNVYDTRGWVKFLKGDDVNGAITDLKGALQIEPIPVAYLHLAKAYRAAKDLPLARKTVAEGIRAAKEKKDAIVAPLEALQKELGE